MSFSSVLLAATADDVVTAAGGGVDHQALARGEVVWVPLASREVSARDLSALMLVRLSAPLPKVVDALQNDADLQMGRSVEIDGDASWREVTALLKTSLDKRELKYLQGDSAASHFHVSRDELQRLQAASGADKVAEAWTQLLAARMESYRGGGLKGLKPYQQPDEDDVYPGRQLNSSAESMAFIRKHYPQVFQQMAEYPARPSTLQQQFVFSLEMEAGRPLYSLKHRLLDLAADRALIFERSYYISHSLDSLDVAILCLPFEGGTQVAMLTHTFTGMVAGMGQAIAHRIGRMKVKEKTLPMFETLQRKFPLANAGR